jgi:hypothetical protein
MFRKIIMPFKRLINNKELPLDSTGVITLANDHLNASEMNSNNSCSSNDFHNGNEYYSVHDVLAAN